MTRPATTSDFQTYDLFCCDTKPGVLPPRQYGTGHVAKDTYASYCDNAPRMAEGSVTEQRDNASKTQTIWFPAFTCQAVHLYMDMGNAMYGGSDDDSVEK